MRDRLYMLRCENRLTKGQMAAKTGVSRTTYTNIENGKRDGASEFWDAVQREFNIRDSDMYTLMKKEQGECEASESQSPSS